MRQVIIAAVAAVGTGTVASAQTTVTFQQGVNGYTGAVDRYIGIVDTQLGADPQNQSVDGSTRTEIFLDGIETTGGLNSGGDTQGLFRFDGIIGNGVGQVPAGAFILDAKFTLTTATVSGAAPTGDEYGVARMLQPFDATTTWNSTGGNGIRSRDGESTRPLGKGFLDPLTQLNTAGNAYSADVTPLVQSWARGEPNHGLVVTAGGTDGWQIQTNGNADPNLRPKLEITYTTQRTQEKVIRQGLDGYAGTSMAWLQAYNSTAGDELTSDGLTLDNAYLDGPASRPGTPDDQAFIKFDNLFGTGPSQIKPTDNILRAYLVVTTAAYNSTPTGGTSPSTNQMTESIYEVRPVLVDWDLDPTDATKPTLFSEFGGGFGPQPGVELGAVADTTWSVIQDAEAYFDVTGVLQSWQNGSLTNYGFSLRAADSEEDGWAIHFLQNPDVAPRLVIITPADLIKGDLNFDGDVNNQDIAPFVEALTGTPTADVIFAGDVDNDGILNNQDIAPFVALLTSSRSVSETDLAPLMSLVPEPTSLSLLAAGAVLGLRRRRC